MENVANRENTDHTENLGNPENTEQQSVEMTLEEALEKLEETIEKLQSAQTTLEDSFKIYREGMEYIRFCNETIDKVEKKVLILNEEGGLSEFSEGTGE